MFTTSSNRFAVGCYVPEPLEHKFKIHVRSQFLSPLITYTVNLVFKFNKKDVERYIGLKYALEGGKTYSSFLSDAREDGWFMAELFQFTSDERCVDLEILFDNKLCPNLLVEGIEFQPLEKVSLQTLCLFIYVVLFRDPNGLPTLKEKISLHKN